MYALVSRTQTVAQKPLRVRFAGRTQCLGPSSGYVKGKKKLFGRHGYAIPPTTPMQPSVEPVNLGSRATFPSGLSAVTIRNTL